MEPGESLSRSCTTISLVIQTASSTAPCLNMLSCIFHHIAECHFLKVVRQRGCQSRKYALRTKSGRDCNKVAEAKLTAHFTEPGYPAFTEAKLVMECRKLYATMLKKEEFLDTGPLKAHYTTKGGLHKLYIAEIEKVWLRE